ncbi:MAG: flagellar basal body-associated FliL family protein [Candidatus Krumholzibacteria bacterium]|nr:flagellar basal body-associated FliL family protein [Candidatus Krumholzibacteria bacterium]
MADKSNTSPDEAGRTHRKGWLENKAILLGVIVIVQALVAIGLTQYVLVPKLTIHQAAVGNESIAEIAADVPQRGIMVGLEDIIVTLAGDAPRPHYLRININLEVKDKATAEAVKIRLPQMRDVVIMTLSDKSMDDLSKPGGKMNLRAEIFRRLDESISGGKLMNVYFSDLVIQ